MKKQTKKNRYGATPAKLAVIAVLAVVQVIVIVRALNHKPQTVAKSSAAAESTRRAPTRRSATTTTAPAIRSPSEPDDAPPWPEHALKDVLAYDPFRPPAWLVVAKPASGDVALAEDDALEQLKQQGASIVIVTSGGKAAAIGGQQFRVGDVIGQYHVTDITTSGVEFTKLQPQ